MLGINLNTKLILILMLNTSLRITIFLSFPVVGKRESSVKLFRTYAFDSYLPPFLKDCPQAESRGGGFLIPLKAQNKNPTLMRYSLY